MEQTDDAAMETLGFFNSLMDTIPTHFKIGESPTEADEVKMSKS